MIGGSDPVLGGPDPVPSGRRRVPGESGIWMFVLGDMLAFAVVFGTLIVTKTDDPGLYERSQSSLHIGLGILNTVVLLSSSLAIALAVRAARGGEPEKAARLVWAALGCAGVFIVSKGVEYGDLFSADVGWHTNDFFMYFFVSTGLHLLHVVVGIAVLGGVLRILRRPVLDARDLVAIENGTTYWHMVDLLWVVLFALLYLLG